MFALAVGRAADLSARFEALIIGAGHEAGQPRILLKAGDLAVRRNGERRIDPVTNAPFTHWGIALLHGIPIF